MLRLIVFGTCLLVAPASAAELPRVAVVGLHGAVYAGSDPLDFATTLATRIDETGQFRGVDPQTLAPTLVGREDLILEAIWLDPGRALLAEGRSLWSQAQPDAAVEPLEQAIQAFSAAGQLAGAPRELWDAYLLLGVTRQALDDGPAAEQAWRQAVALSPTRNPDRALFPPDVVAAYEAVRGEATPQAVPVAISGPDGLTVWIDGVSRGAAPLSVELLPGQHFAIGTTSGGNRAFTSFVVPDQASVALLPTAPTLGPAAESVRARARQVTAVYRALGERAGVDYVVLGGLTKPDELQLQLYSAAADAFSTPLVVPVQGTPDDEALVAVTTLLEQIDSKGQLTNTLPNAIALDVSSNDLLAQLVWNPATLVPPPVGPTETPAKRTPWAWIGAGTAAVVAGGVVAVAATTGNPNQGTITVGPVP